MKSFRLDFQNLIGGAELLLPLMEDNNIPSVINIEKIQYLVIPRASVFFEHFSKPIFKCPPQNLIITIEDFNTYDIIKVDKAHINIFSAVRMILSIDLFVDPSDRSCLIGTLTDHPKSIIPFYGFLRETLPFDLNDKMDSRYLNLLKSSHQVISTSAVVLTFLYTLYNLNENVKIVSNSDGNGRAISYINALRDKLNVIGRDFLEAVENLSVLNAVLL